MAEVNLLKKIADALAHTEIPETFEGSPVADGEVVLLTIEDPDLRKLFVLKNTYSKQLADIAEAHNDEVIEQVGDIFGDMLTSILGRGRRQKDKQPAQKLEAEEPHNPQTCASCTRKRQIYVLDPEYEIVRNAFWGSIKASLSPEQLMMVVNGDYISLSIREGWQVVAIPNKKMSDEDTAPEDPGE